MKFVCTVRLIVTRVSVVDRIGRSKKSLTIRPNVSASGGVRLRDRVAERPVAHRVIVSEAKFERGLWQRA